MRKLTLIFLFFCHHSFASFDLNQNIKKSYSYILNLEFEKATALLELESLQNPSNGFILLNSNYIDFLTIIISEDFTYFKSHEFLKEKRIRSLDNNDKESPYYLYSKAEITLQWAFSRLKFKEYPTAAYELITAYKLLKSNQKKFPDFTLNNKGLGLIHALLSGVPSQFQWILNFAGLKGDFIFGISELNVLLNDSSFEIYEDEVLFLLSFLQINLDGNQNIYKKYLDRIGDRFQDNILLNFTAARLSHNLGMNDYCLLVLNNRPFRNGQFQFYYLDYLHGLSYLHKLDFKNAELKFEYFINSFDGLNYIKSANQKLAWIAFLNKNYNKSSIYLSRVISDGNLLVDEDKSALKYAENILIKNSSSDSTLLLARLLYDGGYYKKARIKIFEAKNPKNSSNFNEEYWYRLARIESKLNFKNDMIIKRYQKSLAFGINLNNYYAPMSALQIALLYEKENNFNKAKIYFNKCLSITDFDYERSIHQKARSGLARILN